MAEWTDDELEALGAIAATGARAKATDLARFSRHSRGAVTSKLQVLRLRQRTPDAPAPGAAGPERRLAELLGAGGDYARRPRNTAD